MIKKIDVIIVSSLFMLFGVLGFDIYQIISIRNEIGENTVYDQPENTYSTSSNIYYQELNNNIYNYNLNNIKCPSDKLNPLIVNGEVFCSLDVPYFNQVLNSEGIETKNTTSKGDVYYMCTAASSVMIMGYHGALKYNSTDELREHMYKSLSSPELSTGNIVIVNNWHVRLCTDGAFGLTSVDPLTGKSMCNWNNNIDFYFKYLGFSITPISKDYSTITDKLNNGYPILLNVNPYDERADGIFESHFVVVKGYSIEDGKQRLLLNDPYRNMNVLVDNGICGGLSVPPSLDGENSVFDYSYHPCILIGGAYEVYK